ncbi:MAG: KGG domain-containing protein [Gemmataceae bacterium]|nr:KGG domain-containing protein [Gemmataceae bacterium]
MARKRGFAAMDQEKQKAIASKGGRAAHQKGTAHEFTAEEAAAAGRKGGEKVSRNRQHMAEIGRRGGKAAHRNAAARGAEAEPASTHEPSPAHEREAEGPVSSVPRESSEAQVPAQPATRPPEQGLYRPLNGEGRPDRQEASRTGGGPTEVICDEPVRRA